MISSKNKIRLSVIALLFVGLAAGFLNFPNLWDATVDKLNIGLPHYYNIPFRLGLDLQGGSHLVYEADVTQVPIDEQISALEGVRDVIERRVNAFGVEEPLVQTSKSGDKLRIIVELAGIKDINQAINMIGETPLLEFKKLIEPTVEDLTDEQKQEIEESEKEAQESAESVLARVLAASDSFGALAQEFSQDTGSADQQGSIGWQKKGALVPEFEQAIFDDLENGEISKELVKSQFGYHIIKKVDERETESVVGTMETEVLSSHILFKTKSEFDFLEPGDEWEYTGLSGKQLKRAQVEFDQQSNTPQVTLEFDDEGKDLFAKITEENVGKVIGIFLDDIPISTPVVNEAISSGRAVISGQFDITEAKLLTQRLNAGALPVPINIISQETVGASLGQLSVEKSLKAGIIGLILVAIFMLLYYRLPGLIAVISLVFYGLIILALFKLVPVTLTLAGIAGFILSLGMAVDANVLVFERLKEELKKGKTITAAIEEAFIRAWPSIRDGNVSTLITCFILMTFSTSLVKGFAITLGIGILISMFSAMVVTKILLKLFSGKKIGNITWLFGAKIKREVM